MALQQAKESGNQSIAAGWQDVERNYVSSVDIACDRTGQNVAARNFVGWKTTAGGGKVYTTFRNGHKVAASGHEGFKLAKGDEARTSKKKHKTQQTTVESVSLPSERQEPSQIGQKRKAPISDKTNILSEKTTKLARNAHEDEEKHGGATKLSRITDFLK